MNLEALKYPIGKFRIPSTITEDHIAEAIKVLQLFPEQIKLLTYNLKDEVLDKPYREGGWTVRQLIHHISDSHHHSYNRFRWALTEDNPTIKAYNQDDFAKMKDYSSAPIAWSIAHMEAVHQKLVYILDSLSEDEWNRTFIHPETDAQMNLKELALMYSWHSMHHFAHLKNALSS
ncbi:MAG: putative metal-dependent hydrolase [Flavobacteriaceae bacterium]|nr:putative metal-dependent hydrolase [Flavobacteriaceae bacterium]